MDSSDGKPANAVRLGIVLGGLDEVQKLIDELNAHLAAIREVMDKLGKVHDLDISTVEL